jgi:hypothetical protein
MCVRCAVLAAPLLVLVACHRRPASAPRAGAAPVRISSVARASDPGVLLVAAVEDARSAIAKGDQIGADNDLAVARNYALTLPDVETALFQSGGRAPATNSAFVSDRLVTATARLTNRDFKGADQALQAIVTAAPRSALPPSLPLIEAKIAIDLAHDAIQTGGYDDARAQLATAEAALSSAPPPGGQAAARQALIASIRAAVKDPQALRTLSPPRLAAWAGQTAAWAGL